jgi:solute:Na+ symporter, SSS family
VFGLYTRKLDHRALLLGWAAGIAIGTWMAVSLKLAGSVYTIHLLGHAVPGYAAVWSLIVNIVVSVLGTVVFRAIGLKPGRDSTTDDQYLDLAEQ